MNATDQAQEIIKEVVGPGDTVVDATAGNGHDTLFLARLVGEQGHVYAFDIQPEAIRETEQRVHAAKVRTSLYLINSNHAQLGQYIGREHEVSAAMFNLGYLPGCNKAIITRTESTLQALNALLPKLKKGGIITIVYYTGHEGGNEEADAVLKWAEKQPPEIITAEHKEGPADRENPPGLVVIRKL